MTFTASGDSSVQLTKVGSPADILLEYSIDNGKYTTYTIGDTINLSDGQSVSMRAVSTNDTISSSWSNYYKFVMSGSIAASGNIQSLLDKTCQRMDVPEYCYFEMFYDCTSLTKAPELPATTLAKYCYAGMFDGCTSLTQAPELPATTLADSCYQYMFQNCTSLTKAPELPATALAKYCYTWMFYFNGQPLTISDKTFDEVADLIQDEYLIGEQPWEIYDEETGELIKRINPVEIICSDKTMLATFDENKWQWILSEK